MIFRPLFNFPTKKGRLTAKPYFICRKASYFMEVRTPLPRHKVRYNPYEF